MRSNNRLNFAVLFVLALLQCFVPLLHAHAHGLSVSHGVHWHDADSAMHTLQAHPDDRPGMENEADDEPVITAAQEFRKDYPLQPDSASLSQPAADTDQPGIANAFAVTVPASSAGTLYRITQPPSAVARFDLPRPFSHAPPSSLSL